MPEPGRALGSGGDQAGGVKVNQPQIGDVLHLELRQADGATVRVLGTVHAIERGDPGAGQGAALEYLHSDPGLELVGCFRAQEPSGLEQVAGMSYELGDPINLLKTSLKRLRGSWAECEDERVDQNFERMLAEVGRVEHLLRSLRTFALFEEPLLRACSTREVLRELAPAVSGAARERGIHIEVDLSNELWVKADDRALRQILLNLVTNAIDAATTTYGWVALRARRVGPAHGSGGVAVEVVDNGGGIAAHELEAALQPFHTTKAEGAGLGLPFARCLVRAMGGELVIESQRGRGTRARVHLIELQPGDSAAE